MSDRPEISVFMKWRDLCEQLKEPSLSKLDNNVYVKMNDNASPVIWLQQKLNENCELKFSSANELNQVMKDYASKSMSFTDYKGPLVKSIELKNFELIEGFKGTSAARRLPKYIKEISGNNTSKGYIGAYSGN